MAVQTGDARQARCTDEPGELMPERHSVGAARVQRFQETTELESHESYTTGYTTVMGPHVSVDK